MQNCSAFSSGYSGTIELSCNDNVTTVVSQQCVPNPCPDPRNNAGSPETFASSLLSAWLRSSPPWIPASARAPNRAYKPFRSLFQGLWHPCHAFFARLERQLHCHQLAAPWNGHSTALAWTHLSRSFLGKNKVWNAAATWSVVEDLDDLDGITLSVLMISFGGDLLLHRRADPN